MQAGTISHGMRPIERTLFSFIWKYSKRDQLVLLVVTSILFPLLYLTLELPKRIINDAIGAQSTIVDFWGFQFDQLTFLVILCGAFLAAVLCHGLVKMRINTMKGVLAERMLRRFRYQLIARVLRFPPPYFERVSQGELVSMVTAESEPMGGLMGDALSQPVLQAGQMITILSFLFLQSVWFGLAACALIPLQAWIIPKLQRQINLLNKKRIQEIRVLAADIGETAQGAAALRRHGGWRYRMSMVSNQLGRLFEIRFEIYQKKFFMKFLNNFIGQLTPFFFYMIGGYLVLQGQVSLGALVAALAAYKDLSSPWKELLAYYNQTQDMALRWEVVTERFAPAGMLDDDLLDDEPAEAPRLTGDIELSHVTVRDDDGNAVLGDLTATFPAGGVIGVTIPSEEDRRTFASLLTREVRPTTGKVTVSGTDLAEMHQGVIATRIGHANARPLLFKGTFGENVMMPMRRRPQGDSELPAFFLESQRAGNSPDAFNTSWIEPSIAGYASEEQLRDRWVELIDGLGSGEALFRRGLEQSFDVGSHPVLAEKLVSLRTNVREAIENAGLAKLVYFFERDQYNPSQPVGENLLFATPRVQITNDLLAEQSKFMGLLKSLELDDDLVNLAREMLDMLRQIFGLDGTDHPLFRNLGLEASAYEASLEIVEKLRNAPDTTLEPVEMATLMTVPFSISAEEIGPAFPEDIQTRILSLRQSHAEQIRESLGELFARLDPTVCAPGLSVLENALFGKLSRNAGGRAEELRKLVGDVLIEGGAQPLVIELIFEMPIALGGANLPSVFAEPLSFTRATLKQPDVLILESALSSYDMRTRIEVHQRLRALLPETMVIYLSDSFENEDVFDAHFTIKQGRFVTEEIGHMGDTDSAASADLATKQRALESTDMFSTLNRRQLRLLAFGARWFNAEPGEVVFLKDDDPTDGAYLILDGEAGLYLPRDGEADQLITTVGIGSLVGELGLIRNEPRALSMVASTQLSCLRIGAEEFLAVVENDAATAFKLLQVVSGYVSN